MIRSGFLSPEDRADLIALARDGSAAHRLGRRATALVLRDDGRSCEEIAKVRFIDDDTIRSWFRLFEEDGIDGLAWFGHDGSACQLSCAQQDKLKAWIAATLPRSTRHVGAFIETELGVVYASRSGEGTVVSGSEGRIALLHRLGLEYHKPEIIPRTPRIKSGGDEAKPKAFIALYENLLNSLGTDEAVRCADAVHPTHAARPVGCWAKRSW